MTVDVFFSYDSADSAVVRRIKDGIEARAEGGVDVYIYEEDPQPGTPISTKAKAGIRRADYLLVLVTENSQHSQWVHQEVGFANGVDCPVVPVRLSGEEPATFGGILGDAEYLSFDPDDPEAFFATFLAAIEVEEPVPDDVDVDVSNKWYLGTAIGTVLWTIYAGSAVLMSDVPSNDPARDLLGVLGLLTLIMPVSTYFDIRYVNDSSDWRPATLLWVLAMVFWLLSGVPGALYLYRRSKKVGTPATVITYALLLLVLGVLAWFLVSLG